MVNFGASHTRSRVLNIQVEVVGLGPVCHPHTRSANTGRQLWICQMETQKCWFQQKDPTGPGNAAIKRPGLTHGFVWRSQGCSRCRPGRKKSHSSLIATLHFTLGWWCWYEGGSSHLYTSIIDCPARVRWEEVGTFRFKKKHKQQSLRRLWLLLGAALM